MQLIIPAYNEEARLPATLKALRAYALSSAQLPAPPLEVIVVDNASSDRTAAVARGLDSALMPIKVIRCETRGKGAAVRAGIAATTAEIVGFMDADGATGLEAFADAAALLSCGADVVIGSRGLQESRTEARHHWLRGVGAAAYRRAASVLVPGVRDTQCGFKILRGGLARDVFSSCSTDGFSFDVELLARAQAAGARIEEIAVSWTDVPGSTFSPLRHGWRSFRELVSIGLALRTAPTQRTVGATVTALTPTTPVAVDQQITSVQPALRLAGGA